VWEWEQGTLRQCWCKVVFHLENSLTDLQRVTYGITTWPNNSTSRHSPKRNENICLCKILYTNIHSNIIH
jgi:hypothetical protein